MKNKLIVLVAIIFNFLFYFFFVSSLSAAALSDLPFGSVVSLQPTDDYMCDSVPCAVTTNNVLPFKLVKMQARKTDTSATPYGNVNGYTINGQSYTYWMLLDNYCWWGKSDCRYYNGNRRSNYASWNADGNTTGTFSNNITDTKSNNILKVLANFYDSLPADIGGLSKEEAVPLFAWDMYGVSTANPPTVGWSGGTWTNTTYDPNTNVNSRFTFTGNNTAPIMNSRIGLVSFHEWQGGNMVYSSNPTSNNGSGGSYCLARFGTANCAASTGYMFDENNTSAGNQNTVASATNPRPRFPWTRSPTSTNSTGVWNLIGSTSDSLGINFAYSYFGVSPTLWLSSSLATIGGTGTYTEPYYINFCDNPANANKLDCLDTGAAVQMTGQQGAVYKFIKMIPKDDDGNTMANSDGTNGSYWMLADNYCSLTGRPSDCVNNTDGTISPNYQFWNPTSDGTRYNNWTTMASTQYGVYSQVLTPMLNDLPLTIGNIAKDTAILTKDYPMYSISAVSGINPVTKEACYLTTGSVGIGTADIVNCTWTDKISLPSYTDWQDGLNAYNYYAGSGSSPHAYSMTRFGTAWAYQNPALFANRFPWLRSILANNNNIAWRVYGGSVSHSVGYSNAYAPNIAGVSPVLWLSSDLSAVCGDGTYASPYRISTNDCQPAPAVKLKTSVATWNNSNRNLEITGLAHHPATGQSILIWAAACNTSGSCKQKTSTIISNGGDQAYNLTWRDDELPAGNYSGTIWVGAHVIASPSDQDNDFLQSNSVNFTIDQRILDLTVVKNRQFNIVLGNASIFNLTPGTNQDVTASVDSSTNELTVSGTLAEDRQIPFGSIILNFKTFNVPQSTVIDGSVNLR